MELFLQLTFAGLAIGSVYSCVALAVVMIYQATDHFNFAQGEMAMFSTFIAWTFIGLGLPIWAAFVLAVAASFVAGIIIDMSGITPGTPPGEISAEAITRFGWFTGPGVITLSLLSVLAISFYNITRARHAQTLADLNRE